MHIEYGHPEYRRSLPAYRKSSKNIGVNRIERIELEYESGEKEHVSEYDFTFEYNEDDDSFSRVADEIAKIFGVRPEIIQTEF